MEINKERPWNPITQDVKDGKLRYYPTPSVLHYGAIPRTYEHPKEQDDLTTLVGDGDPVDIVDVSDLPAEPGQVYWVRILGALAMEDDNAADWKIVAIRLTDPRAKYISGACRVATECITAAALTYNQQSWSTAFDALVKDTLLLLLLVLVQTSARLWMCATCR
jgi:inorganic pyrophosphatase